MDAYDLQARQAPGVLVIFPLILLACLYVPDWSLFTTAAVTLGIAAVQVFNVRIVRARGKEIEPRLYRAWDGMPSTAVMRHRDMRVNQETKARYHSQLRLMGFHIPTGAEEAADTEKADTLYAAAMDEVRRQAKQRENKVVHRENINYGFARNLYASKPIGLIAVAVAGAILCFRLYRKSFEGSPIEWGLLMALGVYMLAWLFLVSPRFVQHQAEAYAKALCEVIPELK